MVLVVPSFCSEPDSVLPLFSSWGSQASMPVFWCETSLPLSKKAVRLQSLKCCNFPCTCHHRVWHNLRPKAGWGYSMRGHSCLLRLPTCWTRAVFLLAAWPFKQPQHVHSLQGSPQPHWSLLCISAAAPPPGPSVVLVKCQMQRTVDSCPFLTGQNSERCP